MSTRWLLAAILWVSGFGFGCGRSPDQLPDAAVDADVVDGNLLDGDANDADPYATCYITKCDGSVEYCAPPGTLCRPNGCSLCSCRQIGTDRHWGIHCTGICPPDLCIDPDAGADQ